MRKKATNNFRICMRDLQVLSKRNWNISFGQNAVTRSVVRYTSVCVLCDCIFRIYK
jgi:hypothetical protein